MFDKLKGKAESASDPNQNFIGKIVNPSKNDAIEANYHIESNQLPTLWLLGKTGAGKSSIIKVVTGNADVEIGNGFKPCTQASHSYEYPVKKPLFRFLDTRGLAEANYDADDDIQACQSASHAIVVVMKLDDPEQSSVINALRQIKKAKALSQILLVHTGRAFISDEDELLRSEQYNQAVVEEAWGSTVSSVSVELEFEEGQLNSEIDQQISTLLNKLGDMLPIIAQTQQQAFHDDLEQQSFLVVKNELLWYSGIAGTSDALPGVGLVSVPLLQGKMLHSLAQQYGIKWGKRELTEFVGAMGTGFGLQYSAKLGLRQLIKLIPVYGQTAGAASAAVLSFSTTYAIGRVACKYMYHRCRGEDISQQALQSLYANAFNSVEKVAASAEDN